MTLRYTICFCRRGDLVLMLHRSRPPNARRWNGLGGKLSPHETPTDSVRREVLEEANIDLRFARDLRLAGVVTWESGVDSTGSSTGMYAFVAELSDDQPTWEDDRATPEGLLSWKPLRWVCDPSNTEVVENIPYFLPGLLNAPEPMEYRCNYADGVLVDLVTRPLRDPQSDFW